MALSLSKQYTFTSGTTILSSAVNSDFDDIYNAFTGLEALTSSFSNLLIDSILRSSGTIQSADGSVGSPGLTFTNDTDCGLYRVTTNEIGMAISGALVAKWTTAGIVINSLKISGLAAGTTAGDAVRYEQAAPLWGYRRPRLLWVSVTTVDAEGGTYDGTSTNYSVLFPDGSVRTVTSSTMYRFDITRNAALSGTKQSGLRSGLSEATNTWYALYAVKATDSTDWVLVGDTVLPLAANYSTLNSNFAADGWVFLGLIRNGDNAGATGDILAFTQTGDYTVFTNTTNSTASGSAGHGTRLASTAGATTLTYSYSAGTGATNIPSNIGIARFLCCWDATTGKRILNAAGAFQYHIGGMPTAGVGQWSEYIPATDGVQLQNGPGSSMAYTIQLAGFWDNVLGLGQPRI